MPITANFHVQEWQETAEAKSQLFESSRFTRVMCDVGTAEVPKTSMRFTTLITFVWLAFNLPISTVPSLKSHTEGERALLAPKGHRVPPTTKRRTQA